MNQLILFYPTGLIGLLICLVTRSPYAHAAILVDGVLWDASEGRGNFAQSDIDLASRRHLAVPFIGDLSGWLQAMQGKRYDYAGIAGWIFGRNRADKVYCFEAAWHALKAVGIAVGDQPGRLSGSDLVELVVLAPYAALRVWALSTVRYVLGPRFVLLIAPGDVVKSLEVLHAAKRAVGRELLPDIIGRVFGCPSAALAVEAELLKIPWIQAAVEA